MKKHLRHQETEAVRGGTHLDKKNGPLATPIYQTPTFEVTDMEQKANDTLAHTRQYAQRKNCEHQISQIAANSQDPIGGGTDDCGTTVVLHVLYQQPRRLCACEPTGV
jgi:cystathionine beta-lyase/cystathionine gamma-synthase